MAGASVQLKAPEPFDFKQPDNWPKWKKRFEQFRVASGLSKEDEPRQVSTLLYCLGEEADDVLTSTNIKDDDRKKYDAVIAKFDAFFQVRKNVIFERARFNRRNQLEGESIEQYITALYRLVDTCEYGTLKKEMLRDRIVVGIRDAHMSEKLQLDPDLTLETAKKKVRQREAVSEQGQQLRGDGSKQAPIVVEQVKGSTPSRRSQTRKRASGRSLSTRGGANSTTAAAPKQICTRCGKQKHDKGVRCPAKDAICRKCNRKGHYNSQCFSKTVATVSSSELNLDTAFLGTVRANSESLWMTKLLLNKMEVSFKLDTGAEVTAISEETYQRLGLPELQQPSKVLYGPARQTLNVVGQFTATLERQSHTSQQSVFVVRGLRNNLLGLPAITSLQLLYRVNSVDVGGEIRKEFPKVFSGLGNLGDEYHIKLKEGAVPHALYTPRNVPIPLREKVKEELARMEAMGVISPIQEPTPWCAGMVVVPKRSGAVRICVDLKPLNESVLREPHPIPKVDETLAQVAGAKVFSKLDANSGFWQIPLAKVSRPLTTFITPFGRYCFNKLPFGISSAPELFQRRMNMILEGLDGVLCHMDDVLVYGANQAEHESRLRDVMKRLEAAGVTLNSDKCEFGRDRVKFLGHLIDREGIRADPEKTSAILQMEAPTNVTELRRFLGMVNQLGKFSARISELSQPLRELLSTKRVWTWSSNQDQAFARIKTELSQPTVLALYNPRAPTKVSADASSYGLGAVLLQQIEKWKPVAYASRSMTDTEKRYAQIEKEALAVTWSCDKFSCYILGRHFDIETDHKPLIPLLSTKNLDNLPPRILRFRLRLARYDYGIQHVPGKLLYTADTLSRAPTVGVNSLLLQEEVELFIEGVTGNLPATSNQLEAYKRAQSTDACAPKSRIIASRAGQRERKWSQS